MKKKRASEQPCNADRAALFACMDKIMEGDCSLTAPIPFQDAELEQKWKLLLSVLLSIDRGHGQK